MRAFQSKTIRLALFLSIAAEAAMAACIYAGRSGSPLGPAGFIGRGIVQFHLLGGALGAVCAPGYDLNDPPFDQTAIWLV
jgi:hypothetical protein